MNRTAMIIAACGLAISSAEVVSAGPYDAMISAHAAANGVPESLVRRVIVRESRYRPHVISKGNYGMMQIRLGTARGLGYTGTARGLLDANTNLTYAVKYLAGAYRAAHGNHDLAVRYYAAGYYYAAKRQGWNSNAQRVTSTPFIGTASASEIVPAVDFAGRVAPPGSQAQRREVRAEANANDHNELRATGPVFNPFKGLSQPANTKRAKGKQADAAVTNPLAALFAPKPEPKVRHHSRRHRN